MPTASDAAAQQHRIRQNLIAAGVVRNVLEVWPRMADPTDIAGSWPALLRVLLALISDGRQRAHATASRYYIRARVLAGADDLFVPAEPSIEPAQLTTALSVTGPGSFKKAIASGRTPEESIRAASATSAASASRLVQDASRKTLEEAVAADRVAIGWARVTDGDPCAFCAMLASRGAVYKTANAAGRRNIPGRPNSYHDRCGCNEKPVFSEADEPEGAAELYDQWLSVTTGSSNPLKTWRKYWNDRQDPPAQAAGT